MSPLQVHQLPNSKPPPTHPTTTLPLIIDTLRLPKNPRTIQNLSSRPPSALRTQYHGCGSVLRSLGPSSCSAASSASGHPKCPAGPRRVGESSDRSNEGNGRRSVERVGSQLLPIPTAERWRRGSWRRTWCLVSKDFAIKAHQSIPMSLGSFSPS